MKIPAHRSALLVLAILLLELVPATSLATMTDPAGVVPVPTTGVPIVDSTREDILAREGAAVAALDALLASKNLSPDTDHLPTSASVMDDHVDPGQRTGGLGDWRVLGAGWRVGAGEGWNGTSGWTMTNASTGKYDTVSSWLISPALDLSAYPLNTGTFPPALDPGNPKGTLDAALNQLCINAPVSQVSIPAFCAPTNGASSEPGLLSTLITLVMRHRYNFPGDLDGGRVVLFDAEPFSSGEPQVLLPLQGSYDPNGVTSLGGTLAFSGYHDWTNESFDLTPWAGKKVWIGFQVATSPLASADPDHFFNPDNFAHEAPYGWQLDDLQVLAPAYPFNLRVESAQGPAFSDGLVPTFAPGEQANVSPSILYAGASPRMTRAELSVTGLGDPIDIKMEKVLQPGEVWKPTVNGTVTDEGSVTLTVNAWNVGPDGNLVLPDPAGPTGGDSSRSFTFPVKLVRDFALNVSTDRAVVDEGAAVVAKANVTNRGNVPLSITLQPDEEGQPLSAVPFSPRVLTVPVGGSNETTWTTASSTRGGHLIHVNATDESGLKKRSDVTYYVHASPPPVFDVPPWPAQGWDDSLTTFPVPPTDSWMWVASAYSPSGQGTDPVLRALPLPGATTSGGRFTDLRLDVRYMATRNKGPAAIELAQPEPIQTSRPAGVGVSVTTPAFWSTTLPVHDPINDVYLSSDSNMSWQEAHLAVDPQESAGYAGVWSANGPELRVIPKMDQGDNSNFSRFFLDDLVLSGVPLGGNEADRVALVHITGAEPYVSPSSTQTGTSLTSSSVTPAQPSICGWENPPAGRTPSNCWRPMSSDSALAADTAPTDLHWRSATGSGAQYLLPDGTPALFSYQAPQGSPQPKAERLVSPPIPLGRIDDPLLTFDHAYYFPGYPADGQQTIPGGYDIFQVGYVEMQYQLDDGTWSHFYRLQPEGGYKSPLGTGLQGQQRLALPTSYQDTDGFHWPGPCLTSLCDSGGYYDNRDAAGHNHWVTYQYPHQTHSIFHLSQLDGVNLTGRTVRFGFHTTASIQTGSAAFTGAVWSVGNVRVTPVSRFAIDGAIESVSPVVPYDWQAIGVGPGTKVPVNVTVRNAGIFTQHFVVNLTTSLFNGADLPSQPPVDLGFLAPGEERSALIDWDVPLGEGVAYQLKAKVVPAEESVLDENPYNDRLILGSEGNLVAKTHADVGLSTLVFPAKGRASLARYIPIVVQNNGNVPVDGLRITRQLERIDGGSHQLLSQTTWSLADPLPPDPAGAPFQTLHPSPAVQLADLFVTPGDTGDYVATLTLETGAADDANPGDNTRVLSYTATEPLASDSFEGSTLRWNVSDPNVWGLGEGFRSAQGLEAANKTSGAIPPLTDAWAVSPPIPLSRAKNAVVNLFAKYDLEKGYDGLRMEVSNDNGTTWYPVDPMNPDGTQGSYPGNVSSANPLSTGPEDQPQVFTGDSHDAPVSLDGWVPLSFNLLRVPQLSQAVSFRDLTPPDPFLPTDLVHTGNAYVAPSMVLDPSIPDGGGQWEIRNETGQVFAQHGDLWWSGNATGVAKLTRDFTVSRLDPRDNLTLQWWDWRAGTHGSSWKGVGANYVVNATQEGSDGPGSYVVVAGDITLLGTSGDWNHLQLQIKPELLDRSKTLTITFEMDPTFRGDDRGWALDDIALLAGRIENGKLVTEEPFTGPNEDNDHVNWDSHGTWTRRQSLLDAPAPWRVEVETGPGGRPQNQWNLTLPSKAGNFDTRLVTPVVDLTELVGARAVLRIDHKFDLAFNEFANSYQGGVVEIQVKNRTGAWDPWKQLFAENGAPSPDLRMRSDPAHMDAFPYNATFPEVGDSFQRFTRWSDQIFFVGGNPSSPLFFFRNQTVNTSYVFTGSSQGYREDDFDLSPYAGQEVRFAFHAWSGPKDPAFKDRYWTIAGAEVLGYVLSTPDARVRFHLGTDQSILAGSAQIDQYEVSGTPYTHSIGLRVDPIRASVGPSGVVTVSGNLTNYGPDERKLVGVSLLNSTPTPFRLVKTLTPKPGTPLADPIAALSGPFDLGPAGSPTDTVPFRFQVYVGDVGNTYDVHLQAVEFGSGVAVKTGALADDVPGRARFTAHLKVEAFDQTTLDAPTIDPPSLPAPGSIVVSGTGFVGGTGDLDVTVGLAVKLNGASTPFQAHVGLVPAGHAFSYRFDPIPLGSTGNYTLSLTATGGAKFDRIYRVGTNETILSESFEDGPAGWKLLGATIATDEAKFGSRSILLGLTDAEYAAGRRLVQGSGMTYTPDLDLSGAGPSPVLTFWSKPLFDGPGTVLVNISLSDGNGGVIARCADKTLAMPKAGRASDWSFVEVPIHDDWGCGLLSSKVRFTFTMLSASGQGWRMDGVTVLAGFPYARPANLSGGLVDSASKVYRVSVTNPSLSPRNLSVGIDANASKLSPVEASWLRVDPPSISLAAGETREVDLRVSAPSARGAFPRDLQAVFALRDLADPYVQHLVNLSLAFRPLPRQDLSAAVSVDGKALDAQRDALEEAVPHEIDAVITNQGTLASAPADVRIQVIDDATGDVLFTQTSSIPALDPFTSAEVTAVASASWKPEFGHRGNVTLRVVADPDHRLVDYDRSNDDLSFPLEVVRLIRPDLVIERKDFTVGDSAGRALHEATPGELLRISAVVENQGFADAHDVTIRLLADGALLKEETIPLLRAGDRYTLRANQFASNASTTYSVLAFTGDLELQPDNNAQTLELAIFPAEILLGAEGASLTLPPGTNATVPISVTDNGPYPVALEIALPPGERLGSVDPARLALGPGENATVTLRLAASATEPAGDRSVVVKVRRDGEVVAQRTVDVSVAAAPSALVIPGDARGRPDALSVGVDIVNTGNVALAPVVRLVDDRGSVLGEQTIDPIPLGRSRFVNLTGALPAGTPPGRLEGSLVVLQDGAAVRTTPVQMNVLSWSALNVTVGPPVAAPQGFAYDLHLSYQGNAPGERRPVLLGLPPGVQARFNVSDLQLAPGEARDVQVVLNASAQTPTGLYVVEASFPDSSAQGDVLGDLTPLSLDVRAARAAFASVAPSAADSLAEGSLLSIDARVQNVGDAAFQSLPVQLFVDGVLVDAAQVSLEPGATGVAHLSWRGVAGSHGVIVALDAFGPHAQDAPAWSRTLRVVPSLVPGADVAHRVPAPDLTLSLAALAAVALLLAWEGRRRGR